MIFKKKVIIIISARGGSKRIKNKNLKRLGKKSLLNICITKAKKSKYVDLVTVNTESKKIRSESELQGIKVPFLRDKYFDDKSTVEMATAYYLKNGEKYFGKFDIVVQLMPNCPFFTTKNIDNALENFIKKKFDSQISYSEFLFSKPEWAVNIDQKKNKITPLVKKTSVKSSNSFKKSYFPTGAVWISKSHTLLKHKTFRSPKFGYFICDFVSAIDVDTQDELKVAKLLFK